MKIVDEYEKQDVITKAEAVWQVKRTINRFCGDHLYVLKYEGQIISISGEYYKIAWNTIGDIRRALSLKFGYELAEALVENEILEIIKVYV